MYKVVKTYGHDIGLSCTFRQWRAKSHCRFLHGYALAFEFTFESEELDANGWVIDFGALKRLRQALVNQFDHTTIVAADDPALDDYFRPLGEVQLIDLRIVADVGCESFAKWAYHAACRTVTARHVVDCTSVKVSEHGANSAIYCP